MEQGGDVPVFRRYFGVLIETTHADRGAVCCR